MEKNRALAVKLALERIDRFSKRLTEIHEQNKMLASLINEHDLKEPSGVRLQRVGLATSPLTVKMYRDELGKVANRYGQRYNGKTRGIHEFFANGSALFPEDFLERIAYAPQVQTMNNDDEDEGHDTNEYVEADNEMRVGERQIAEDTGHPESEATTIQDEIANTPDESSQRDIPIDLAGQPDLAGQRGAGQVLAAPVLSPMSAHAEAISAGQIFHLQSHLQEILMQRLQVSARSFQLRCSIQ